MIRLAPSLTPIALALAASAGSAAAQGRSSRDAPRPIEAGESPWTEELTWMEVRDLVRAGKTTIIIGTGGVEQNGPYLAGGKHNLCCVEPSPHLSRATAEASQGQGDTPILTQATGQRQAMTGSGGDHGIKP